VDLDLTRVFVKVIQNGSFSRAANVLKLPKSTVSKAITRLERETGTQLILRTTRSLSLTAAGRVFFETCQGPIQVLEDAQKSMNGADSLLSGSVRITAPEDLGNYVIAPVIAQLAIRHAQLSFERHYTDELVDLVKDGFDLAVRVGRVGESRFKVRRVGEVRLIAVASPQCLRRCGRIRIPRDLERVDALTYNVQEFKRWTMRSSKGTVHVPIQTRISSNQMSSLLKMAVAGGGVAWIPQYLCRQEVESGQLVRVLPEWNSPALPVSILTPLAPSSSVRLKMTTDHLTTALHNQLGL